MTPSIFTFDGIKVDIYPEDHLPMHIHAKYNGCETIYAIEIDNNKLISIESKTKGAPPLPPQQDKKVRKFLKKHWKQVAQKWMDFIVLKKPVTLTRISGL